MSLDLNKPRSSKLHLAVLSILVGVLALGGVAKATYGFSWANVERYAAQLIADKVENPPQEEQVFGAVAGPDLPNPNCTNDLCTWVVTGNWQDATNTIVSVPDPFEQVTSTGTGGVVLRTAGGVSWTGASTTVDLVRLVQTGIATSSYKVSCGSSVNAVDAPTVVIVTTTDHVDIPTSSPNNILENNMTAALGNRANAGSIAKIMMGPSKPYFTCVVNPNGDGPASFTNGDNAVTGKFTVRFTRTLIR